MIAQIQDVETPLCRRTKPRGIYGAVPLPLMHPREFLSQFPLTYNELANWLGVTVYAVDNWMGNRAQPSRQTQRQIADLAARLQENSTFRKLVLATEVDE
ncbi:hypothetical protein VF14_08805 [Nostoc linckia z18]|uniref:Uncharacterized protein n=2 Tax=Nostoc linckia TaxID=92942 RepID=A0A9Q5ZES6_NOSLI|nr:hypothetical protein [Nostoc linckia]PHK42547.1 hypothetical protein VF12_02450 [Nostoc linckia z15]PHK44521.1 hypothetical protein VF13_21150 [Nostoc linckia z16]PHJ59567.1 hypothetical protein VF02_24430 [Nostoc linckia z1]PHJ65156.1 hypothetical protein VF05_21720 [Nostoc linckia z3]PHJ69570.1 hypothetical protein VF03_23510 [Nostoc linckia z2]